MASLLVAGALLSVWVQLPGRLSDQAFFGLLVLAPLAAAVLIWIPRLPAQLLARGAWWSFLLTNTLLTCVNELGPRHFGVINAAASALALLATGSQGLDDGTGRFKPVAFQGTLRVALVLAMADTGALLWLGIGGLLHADVRFILMVPLMAAGVVGLLRLRLWGLLAGMAGNILVATMAATRVLGLPDPIRGLFIGTALLQLLVPLPMLVAIIRRRPPPADRWPRAKRAIVTGTIVAIAAFAVYSSLIRQSVLLAY